MAPWLPKPGASVKFCAVSCKAQATAKARTESDFEIVFMVYSLNGFKSKRPMEVVQSLILVRGERWYVVPLCNKPLVSKKGNGILIENLIGNLIISK